MSGGRSSCEYGVCRILRQKSLPNPLLRSSQSVFSAGGASVNDLNFGVGTCGEACWGAKEDICRCFCRGRNHGITRTGATAPVRQCRKGMWQHRLTAVCSYGEAQRLVYDALAAWTREHGYGEPWRDRTFCAKATPSQSRWAEVVNANIVNKRGEPDAYLVWERV